MPRGYRGRPRTEECRRGVGGFLSCARIGVIGRVHFGDQPDVATTTLIRRLEREGFAFRYPLLLEAFQACFPRPRA
jgi:hypothetical protein